ncbi:universal stress protein [Halobaculum sp. EA56]|uniref:universal stress protein n=1 Tax=Halobaculum sp. EA56 TaxID=3421648 RepID=UPI003EB76237
MTFVIPFDMSELAETALVRAKEFNQVFDEEILVLTVIPKGDVEYAREKGWLKPDEEYELENVISTLHERIVNLVPEADFRHFTVDKYAPQGAIANELREAATDADAAVVFLGSENAGHIVSGVGEVGPSVAAEDSYDVYIVRNKAPSKIHAVADSPTYESTSGFYQ